MAAETKIRPIRQGEFEALVELGKKTFTETFGDCYPPEDLHQYLTEAFEPNKLQEEWAAGRCLYFLVTDKKELLGYAKLRHEGEYPTLDGRPAIELERLYVRQGVIQKGLGSQLMEACLQKAKELGKGAMWLGVWEENHRARAFYEKWGFTVFGKHAYPIGETMDEDLLMKKWL
ncbi:MAG: GNAT family N-acetyltransferase [Bacteroidota bacterium]